MDMTQAAQKRYPGTAWNLRGDVLEQADDGSPRVDVPSLKELQSLMDSDVYVENRLKAYPPIGDQLDAIWKKLSDPSYDVSEMLAAITAVKNQFPKP